MYRRGTLFGSAQGGCIVVMSESRERLKPSEATMKPEPLVWFCEIYAVLVRCYFH